MNNFKWQKIAKSETELQSLFTYNQLQLITVFGKKLCLVKTDKGIYAVDDKCPHNGASLSMGQCNEHNEIVCPMHRYPFNLETGKASAGMALTLQTYPIKIQDDGVFIGMKKSWWEN